MVRSGRLFCSIAVYCFLLSHITALLRISPHMCVCVYACVWCCCFFTLLTCILVLDVCHDLMMSWCSLLCVRFFLSLLSARQASLDELQDMYRTSLAIPVELIERRQLAERIRHMLLVEKISKINLQKIGAKELTVSDDTGTFSSKHGILRHAHLRVCVCCLWVFLAMRFAVVSSCVL